MALGTTATMVVVMPWGAGGRDFFKKRPSSVHASTQIHVCSPTVDTGAGVLVLKRHADQLAAAAPCCW